MALMICTDCGNQVSTRANSCPKCGAPINTTDATPEVEIKKVDVSFDDTVKTAGRWLGALLLIGALVAVLLKIVSELSER